MSPPQRIHLEPQSYAPDRRDSDEMDAFAVFRTLWRGKLIIAILSLLFMLGGGWYAFNMTVPVYTANTVLALDSRAERNVTSVESVVSGLPASGETINTEIEVMRSRILAGRLVERLGLMDDPEFNPPVSDGPRGISLRTLVRGAMVAVLRIEEQQKAPLTERRQFESTVTRVLDTIEVENSEWSYVFNITVTTTDPEKSVRIANTLADLYIEDQLQVKFDATAQATEWLSQRVAELRTDLEASEAAAKEFNASIDLISAATLDALNRQLKDMRDRLETARSDAATSRQAVADLEAAISTGDRQAIVAAAADPRLEQAAADIARGRAIEATFDARLDQAVQRSRLAATRAETQVASLEASVSEIAAQVEKQSRDLVTLEQLEREAEANRLIYESFLVRLREISIQQGIQTADARILSPAIAPINASAPRKSRIIVLAWAIGVMLGSAVVMLLELRNRGFRTAQELERATGRTVLGQIPVIPIRRRGRLIEYMTSKPTSAAAEAARNLRTSIELSNVDDPPKIIMSTSSVPGEGKTTTAIMLAHHFAALNRKVLLLEGDIRRKILDQYVDSRGKPGLVSVISGQVPLEEAILHDDRLQFDILPGEKSQVNAADLFASRHFAEFITDIRDRYDHVIIDSPPVLVVPDARSIGRFVDAIVFSVKWNSTSPRQVEQGLAAFESVGTRVSGLVLTHVSHRKMRSYGYGGDYGGYGYSRYYGRG